MFNITNSVQKESSNAVKEVPKHAGNTSDNMINQIIVFL